MKKKTCKNKMKKNQAYSLLSGEPIDISNCIQVGEDVKFPEYEINKKIQKKLLKELPFDFNNKKSLLLSTNNDENKEQSQQKVLTRKFVYSSGIIKTITKNEKDEIINETIDYSNIKQNYIQNLKNNLNDELELLVNNSFLLYNRKPIIKKIVINPVSTKVLADKICLWKYYIKDLSNEDKAYLIRRLFFYIEKFSNDCYEEFIEIKEIKEAYKLLNPTSILNNSEEDEKKLIEKLINKFHFLNNIIGCDSEGNPLNNNEAKDDINFKTYLFTLCKLNKKDEFKGLGFGYAFLRELRDIANMFTKASIIFDDIFQECYKIFDIKELNNVNKIESYRILWNFYSDYFIENIFIINFFIQLKSLFGMYQQFDIVKFMHKLILVKYNIFDFVEKIKEQLIKIIGPAGEFDDYKNIKKMNNIDDIIKYIKENDNKKNKKQKKKKKNLNKINNINLNNIEDKKNEEADNDFDMDDGLSILSENDSVLEDFRNDIMAETEYNLGEKIIPILSSEFLKKFSDE